MAGAGAPCFSGRPCSIVDPLDHRRRQCPRMQGVEAFATGCLADLRARGHLHGQSCKPLACGRDPVSAVHRVALHRARENVGALEEQVQVLRSPDGGCLRPIRLDRDDREAVLFDQPPRDRRPRAVKLRRAMRRFSEQDDATIGEAIERRPEIGVVEGRQSLGRLGSFPAACARATGQGCGLWLRDGRPRPSPARRSMARTRQAPSSSSSYSASLVRVILRRH